MQLQGLYMFCILILYLEKGSTSLCDINIRVQHVITLYLVTSPQVVSVIYICICLVMYLGG